jgi:hypothetical protein
MPKENLLEREDSSRMRCPIEGGVEILRIVHGSRDSEAFVGEF